MKPVAPELHRPLETQQQKDGDVREEQSAVKYEKAYNFQTYNSRLKSNNPITTKLRH